MLFDVAAAAAAAAAASKVIHGRVGGSTLRWWRRILFRYSSRAEALISMCVGCLDRLWFVANWAINSCCFGVCCSAHIARCASYCVSVRTYVAVPHIKTGGRRQGGSATRVFPENWQNFSVKVSVSSGKICPLPS